MGFLSTSPTTGRSTSILRGCLLAKDLPQRALLLLAYALVFCSELAGMR